MDFMIEVNRLTSEVVFARTTAHPPKSILAHEMLFVLQANLEAKAFYAVWRNFISPLVNRPVKPEPWTGDDEIRISTKTGRVDLKTGGIIKGIVRDLRIANFDWLAREFEHTHSGIGAHIRNSVAHATFLCPSDKNGPAWVFAEYVCDATGAVRVREHLLSHGDFTQFMRRFLTFRSAAASAYDARLKTASESTEEFVAENQMNKGEMLQCRLEKGTVRVTSQGTPFW